MRQATPNARLFQPPANSDSDGQSYLDPFKSLNSYSRAPASISPFHWPGLSVPLVTPTPYNTFGLQFAHRSSLPTPISTEIEPPAVCLARAGRPGWPANPAANSACMS